MAKIERANLQLASESVCRNIAAIDARKLSSSPGKYIQDNLLGYYVLVNCWLHIIKQWSQYGWNYLYSFLQSQGLIDAIKNFDNAATELINGAELSFGLARTLYDDIVRTGAINSVPTDVSKTIHGTPLSAALFIFRFPKRFSPLGADILRDASIADFIERQRILKRQQRRPHPNFIIKLVREEISRLIPWKSLIRALKQFDITDLEFTGGVSLQTSASLLSKLKWLVGNRVEYFPIPFGIPLVSHSSAEEQRYWGKVMDYEVHTVRLSAVPKNYKSARIIAPEDVYRQAKARRYFTIMDRFLPGLIRLHDQSQNQQLALLGSIDGSLATIDLHAASDSVTNTVFVDVFPNDFVKIMGEVLPTHYLYKGKEYLLQSRATMGNSVTFWLESVLFAGISLAAVRFYNRMSGESDETVSVFGDDIIVPTGAAPTVIEFLEALGFVVNEDKSFFDRNLLYRESCGEEYLEGTCVSSIYFPRFPLEGSLKEVSNRAQIDSYNGSLSSSITALVDLQHKMFRTCVPASLLLAAIILETNPRMTSSTPDEGYNDLWSYISSGIVQFEPYAGPDRKLVKSPDRTRIAHSTPYAFYQGKRVDYTHEERLLYDLYKYQQFLKFGPRYDDPLSELLGVSSKPLDISQVASRPEVAWKFTAK